MRLVTFVATAALAALPFAAGAQQSERLPARATIPSPPPLPVLPPVPSVAPGYSAPSVHAGTPRIVGTAGEPVVGIVLGDAIAMALLKNPNLAIAAGNRRIAFYGIEAAKGAFDVRFQLEPEIQRSIAAPQNPFFAGPSYGPVVTGNSSVSGSVSGVLPNGQSYSVSLSQTRATNNEIVNLLNPTYLTALSFVLTQPLLRDAGMNAPKRAVELSVINANQTQEQTLATVSDTIGAVEDAYWDLVSAWRNVAIQEEAMREAVAQQRSTIRLARHGAGAPVDAVESGAQVDADEAAVASALQSVATVQNQLKSEIAAGPSDPVWTANLVPTSPVLQVPPAPAFARLVQEAMQNRPEIRQTLDAELQADVDVAYARNQLRPQVDLKLGYTTNGYAGTLLPLTPSNPLYAFVCPTSPCSFAVPPPLVGGFGQSYNTLLQQRYPYWNAGLVYSLPLGNRTARAQLEQALEQQRDAQIALQATEERVVVEARNALQTYESALSRLAAARAARHASEVVYASELRKFHNGTSTTFLVLARQVQLAQYRGLELQAQTDLNKAVVELQRVSGAILTANGVNVETLGSRALPAVP
ncbi:MAG TPA: TolC family protein [Candidatus Dormibacteraeota bacterium]|nr:TolC family protein [Candidatus Dormibacteraeota bacterium]